VCSVGIMSNFVQWAQLSVTTAQLSELQSIHAQFQAQHNAQRQQALLADMLFRTEQRARQLSVLASQDPLVAAIAAEEWLGSVRFVSADLFLQVEHKRSWAGAVSRLQALCAPLDDPGARALAGQVRAAGEEARRLHQELGGANPEPRLASANHEHAVLAQQRDRAGKLAAALGAASIGLPFVLFVGSAIASGIAQAASKKTVDVDSGCIGTLCFLSFLLLAGAAAYQVASWSEGRAKARRAEENLRRVRYGAECLRAFIADPNRGGVLNRFHAEHPAYGRPLPNVDDLAAMPPAGPVSSHVIERQTVVVRCKFCRALTPVDAGVCQYCGAGHFS
jgi:hypothetical protein